MKAVIIQTPTFVRSVEAIATEDEYGQLEKEVLANPEAGKVIAGGGGIRKIRFAVGSQGKSGGARAIYYYKNEANQIFFLVAYAKSESETLTKAEVNLLKELVKGELINGE